MPQEDYLKRQIDQFAKVLAKLLMKLTEMKNTGSTSAECNQVVNEVLVKEAQLSVEGLLDIPADRFVSDLVHANKLNAEQLELLGDVLYTLSNGHPMERELSSRALAILEHIHSNSKIYSMERHFRIEQIKKRIYS